MLWRKLKSFVYNACLWTGVEWPDIPVKLVEFYGQIGEDLIVASLLEAKAQRDNVDLRKARYLEIGGNHPFATSATFLLRTKLGMTGVIVEANPRLIRDLMKGGQMTLSSMQRCITAAQRAFCYRFHDLANLARSIEISFYSPAARWNCWRCPQRE